MTALGSSCDATRIDCLKIEMAHRFDLDRGHPSDLETGKKNVCLPMLEVLASGFGSYVVGETSYIRKAVDPE